MDDLELPGAGQFDHPNVGRILQPHASREICRCVCAVVTGEHDDLGLEALIGRQKLLCINPGRESLMAVISPAKTDYLYFVSRNDGSHHFSASLKEHNRAVVRYQKRRRSISGKKR